MTDTDTTAVPAEEPAALYEIRGHVALITLNRPRALNAVNAALSAAVGESLERAAADPEVRAVVITGAGRAFCAGADLKALARGESLSAPGSPEWGFAGFVRHWIDKPVIAAVNGYAMGGGTEIVLASDLAVIAEDAALGLPEVTRGLIAAAGGVVRLQHQIPLKRALELVLTGDPIDASTALEWGLVNRVTPAGDALEVALGLADRIAMNAPLAVRRSKTLLHSTASAGSTWDPAWSGIDPWAANQEAMAAVFSSSDAVEGPRAFAEKRRPEWTGR
ncbi:enoyl-CoA hydratase/carnithine racemase [Microbacterium resistens]|uniref:Enoyl-CoA hydratase/carnithine racemase n=1 Tax=Microbacterium resistens TaxID=156977 RepID=A0ABU1SFH9_9MICO|nr:crotonase/enoyl-CoA hydratase family protein [Microbacterium resistens]MDR6868355.1 enoyl-CoA hydratase/carnithine racemase [Microbacterium resistens]